MKGISEKIRPHAVIRIMEDSEIRPEEESKLGKVKGRVGHDELQRTLCQDKKEKGGESRMILDGYVMNGIGDEEEDDDDEDEEDTDDESEDAVLEIVA